VAASSCQFLIQFSNSQTVIASEAKQSILLRKERMDCFASLAMTVSQLQIQLRDLAAPRARAVDESCAQ
jgi:hypothetical protein